MEINVKPEICQLFFRSLGSSDLWILKTLHWKTTQPLFANTHLVVPFVALFFVTFAQNFVSWFVVCQDSCSAPVGCNWSCPHGGLSSRVCSVFGLALSLKLYEIVFPCKETTSQGNLLIKPLKEVLKSWFHINCLSTWKELKLWQEGISVV